MNLAFLAADTLGVTLYQVKSQLKASEIHHIKLGAWRIEMQIDAVSDVIQGHEAGFWVTLNKTVHLYVIVRESENWLFVLDSEALKVCGGLSGFVGLTTKDRVLEFKPAIKGVFRWQGQSWEKIQLDGK